MAVEADLLIEIGTEELPPKSLARLSRAFLEEMQARLDGEANLPHGELKAYATPRRLALVVSNLPERQSDITMTRRGPSLAAAFDEAGAPTKAALGFAAANGIDVNELERDEKDQRVYCQVTETGRSLAELLPALVEAALAKLPVDRRMRWGASRAEFARPIHWVTLLHGDTPVEGAVLGIPTGRTTYGHRFMAPGPVELASANDYVEALSNAHVMADFGERRARIREALEREASNLGGAAVIDDALLDEVTSLVEWPVVLAGRFDEEFLEVPTEVLISAMKDHQRYFHLVDDAGVLLSSFLMVANIESAEPAVVVSGNEKVIRPRLADAAFFYEQDCGATSQERLERLRGLVFQNRLGSYHDKATRISALAGHLAERLQMDPGPAVRAGLLCKADLVSSLVNEFPSLQGVMGGYYAANDGEEGRVADAIREQYLPAFAGDRLPVSDHGRVVSLADKLDTLVGLFGIDQPPTGSRDPFGLRRAAIGVLRIVIEGGLALDLRGCVAHAASLFTSLEVAESAQDALIEYILERLNFMHQEQGASPEVFLAVKSCAALAAGEACDLVDIDRRMRAVEAFRREDAAVALAESNKRVSNILTKQAADHRGVDVDEGLLADDAEKGLYAELQDRRGAIAPLVRAGNYLDALHVLATLQASIDRFFDEVLVMDENAELRRNRLALLSNLRRQFLEIADVSQLHTV